LVKRKSTYITITNLFHGSVEGKGMIVRNAVPNFGCPRVEVIYPGQAVGITMPAACKKKKVCKLVILSRDEYVPGTITNKFNG
jgi:hypothetical protein